MWKLIQQFVKEDGASAAEYALLMTLITLALVASLGGLGAAIQAAINNAGGLINPS